MRKRAVSMVALGVAVTAVCAALGSGTPLAWSPEPASYGIVEQQNVPVTMSTASA